MNLVLALVLLFAPAPPPRLVPIQNGIVVIVWENDGADTVIVDDIDNEACRLVTEQNGLFLGTVLTQAPQGPPYEARCAIEAGDRLYLLRYRDRAFLGQAGPFVVPMRVWLPMVRR
jgi:hypothetical protein